MAGHARNGFAGPISLSQFFRSFQQAWSSSSSSSNARLSSQRAAASLPRRLGIAVSGGADSMALTFLCKQLEKSKLVERLVVKAFVVDHKAREESTREAQTVARWLEEMGVDSEILELQWPDSESNPSKASAFETHARRLRFQALGRACRSSAIETLLMGHHQDDNVETTLWRLCSGARGAGLSGIPQVARIPECHGLYGVSESGSCSILKARQAALRPQIHLDQTTNAARVSFPSSSSSEVVTASTTDIQMSTGGILVCRPLLSFPKSRLLDTCHHNRVPYVSDPTNFDPTLTPRNAIRSLLSSNRLPRALQAPSILSLIKKSQDLLRESTELSNSLLKECKVHDFNAQVGTMIVQCPSFSFDLKECQRAGSGSSFSSKDRQIQAMTLRRITELLSPFEENHFPLQSFEAFTGRVFPADPDQALQQRQPFTVGGVMFRPVVAAAEDRKPKGTPSSQPDCTSSSSNTNTTSNNIWLLSRQPYMRHRLPEIRLEAPVVSSSAAATATAAASQIETADRPYSPWILWDNRYWFRMRVVMSASGEDRNEPHQQEQHSQTIPLIIRPLQQSDLKTIYRLLGDHDRNHKHNHHLQKLLSRQAPGSIRFTVPLITTTTTTTIAKGEKKPPDSDSDSDSKGAEQEQEHPLALPTLQIRIPGSSSEEHGENPAWTLEWEWMYKSVDTQALKLMGWLLDDIH